MKKFVSLVISVLLIVSLFGCSNAKSDNTTEVSTTTTTTQPQAVTNPLTGKDGYSESAVGVRPVAIVVENTKAARPQWGITSPDIIVEGEVEGGISRMLWLYADYNSVPDKVGPLRSARPSFIKFSELFDSIYIHWGGSHSKTSAGYTGGYETIEQDGVDDIDGMDGGKLFGRDSSRDVSIEHRGILHGNKLASAIKDKGYRTTIDDSKFTTLEFNDDVENAGTDSASTVKVTFSSRTDTRKFTYSTDDSKYHTKDWQKDVKFENVIVLMDNTTYIKTPYKSSSTTYLNYSLTSGDGYLFTNGTKASIKWSVNNGKLQLSDSNGNTVKLNQGKSYIGLASANHSGKVVTE